MIYSCDRSQKDATQPHGMVTGLTWDSAHNRNVEKSWIGFSIQDILTLGVFQSFLVGLCENVLKGDSIDVQR